MPMKNQPIKKNRGLVWKISRSIPNKRLKLKHKSGMSILTARTTTLIQEVAISPELKTQGFTCHKFYEYGT